jgi:hypothetical protein
MAELLIRWGGFESRTAHFCLRRENSHDPQCLHSVNDGPISRALLFDALPVPVEAHSLLGGEQAAAGEQERVYAEASDCLDLRWPIAKPPVLAEYRQSAAAAQLEPLDVRYLLVTLPVDLVMGAQRPASSAQSFRDAMAT